MILKAIWIIFGQIVEDIKLVLRSFQQWRIFHVQREANEATHNLAKEVIRRHMDNIWMEESPTSISDTVVLELETLVL